jgi:hypothetical protein
MDIVQNERQIEAKVQFGITHCYSLRAAKSHFESKSNFGKSIWENEGQAKV